MELTPTRDMSLNVQALLHSRASTSTAYVGHAEVASSTERTTIDVTKIAEAPAPAPQPAPGGGLGLGLCILGICL